MVAMEVGGMDGGPGGGEDICGTNTREIEDDETMGGSEGGGGEIVARIGRIGTSREGV